MQISQFHFHMCMPSKNTGQTYFFSNLSTPTKAISHELYILDQRDAGRVIAFIVHSATRGNFVKSNEDNLI